MSPQYEYRTIAVDPPSANHREVCLYLEALVNKYAGEDWIFAGLQTIWLGKTVPPKPLSAAVFRREKTPPPGR